MRLLDYNLGFHRSYGVLQTFDAWTRRCIAYRDTLVVASERRCGCRWQVSFVAADDFTVGYGFNDESSHTSTLWPEKRLFCNCCVG